FTLASVLTFVRPRPARDKQGGNGGKVTFCDGILPWESNLWVNWLHGFAALARSRLRSRWNPGGYRPRPSGGDERHPAAGGPAARESCRPQASGGARLANHAGRSLQNDGRGNGRSPDARPRGRLYRPL